MWSYMSLSALDCGLAAIVTRRRRRHMRPCGDGDLPSRPVVEHEGIVVPRAGLELLLGRHDCCFWWWWWCWWYCWDQKSAEGLFLVSRFDAWLVLRVVILFALSRGFIYMGVVGVDARAFRTRTSVSGLCIG